MVPRLRLWRERQFPLPVLDEPGTVLPGAVVVGTVELGGTVHGATNIPIPIPMSIAWLGVIAIRSRGVAMV